MTARTVALAIASIGALIGAGCSEQVTSNDASATTVTSAPVTTDASDEVTGTETTTRPTTSTSSTSTTTTTTTTTVAPPTTVGIPTTTSCDKVVHIGDSTAVPLFDASAVGGQSLTLDARYRAVGVDEVYPDNDGARSIVERLGDQANAFEVAENVAANGYDGCWVLMIGTNDAANIAAGSNVSADDRIRAMLDTIGDSPVVWVDAVTQLTDTPYRNASMLDWDQALYRVAADYPNVRVLRWFDKVEPQWFREDGIHYTVEGSAQRAAITAQSLVDFFPG